MSVKVKYKYLRENSFIYCSPRDFNKLIMDEFNSISIPSFYEPHKVLQLLEIYIYQKRYLFDANPPELTMRRYIRALANIAVQNYESETEEGLI